MYGWLAKTRQGVLLAKTKTSHRESRVWFGWPRQDSVGQDRDTVLGETFPVAGQGKNYSVGETSPAGEKQDLCAKPSVVKRALSVWPSVLAKAPVARGEQTRPWRAPSRGEHQTVESDKCVLPPR